MATRTIGGRGASPRSWARSPTCAVVRTPRRACGISAKPHSRTTRARSSRRRCRRSHERAHGDDMKIVCLGGGPAGLYFSILAKKANPSWEVTVIERNRPDDTFGWGVVFSDKTMAGFREADPETHLEITRAFRHWDDIDVHFKGRTITSGGHGFCGIARIALLQIPVSYTHLRAHE